MAVGGQRHAPADLPPGNTWYLSHRRLGGPQSRSGQARKISLLPWSNLQAVHPLASRYTNYAIPGPNVDNIVYKN